MVHLNVKDTISTWFGFCHFLYVIIEFCFKKKKFGEKLVDVVFLENLLVDCRQIGQIYCNLHLADPPLIRYTECP